MFMHDLFTPWHLLLILAVVLLVLGPKRLPGAARSIGNGMREFKDSLSSTFDSSDDDDDESSTAHALGKGVREFKDSVTEKFDGSDESDETATPSAKQTADAKETADVVHVADVDEPVGAGTSDS
jgi:sec-independent protein translocase protein TatA